MPSKSIKSLLTIARLVMTIMFLIVSTRVYSTVPTTSQPLRLAVASNFLETSKQLAKEFEKSSGVSVQISSGSSGKLYHQIMHGAPYDLFLSADREKPQQLVANQKAKQTSLKTYAQGQLVLWLKNCGEQTNLDSLQQARFSRIAMANPKLAPYGAASQALLESTKLWLALKNKLVFPENIAQVAQLAKLGVVDAAFIAKTHQRKLQLNTTGANTACIIELSKYSYPAIEQQLVIISRSSKLEQAEHFVRFIQSPSAQALIKNMGYLVN